MRLKVNPVKKKELQKRYLKTKPIMYWIPYIFVILAVIFTIGFLIYGLAIEDRFVVTREIDPNYGEKDYFLIGAVTIGVDIIFLFFGGIAKLALWRLSGKYLNERVNESLIIKGDLLEYGYQNFAGSVEGDRVIVKIPMNRLNHVTYSKSLEKITLKGELNSSYYDDYAAKKTRADTDSLETGEWILFDYFEPSLYQTLREQNVGVKEYE